MIQFDLHGRGTTTAREVRGGVTTFLTMAYILFANPAILASAGVPFEAAAAATAAAAAICTLLMGLGANFPIALAPGMGLNAVVAMQVVGQTGSWQAAMGLVVLDGLLVLALVVDRRSRSGDDGDSDRPAPRDQRRHRPIHRAHRGGERAAGDDPGEFGCRVEQQSARGRAAGDARVAARSPSRCWRWQGC